VIISLKLRILIIIHGMENIKLHFQLLTGIYCVYLFIIYTNKIGSTILREWITTDCRNTPSTTNPEDEEIVDAPGNHGNASMLEEVKRPNP